MPRVIAWQVAIRTTGIAHGLNDSQLIGARPLHQAMQEWSEQGDKQQPADDPLQAGHVNAVRR